MLSSVYLSEQNSISKDTTIGPMIQKEMKYNLHCGEVRGDEETKLFTLLQVFIVRALVIHMWRLFYRDLFLIYPSFDAL